jgi:hypothetical protein
VVLGLLSAGLLGVAAIALTRDDAAPRAQRPAQQPEPGPVVTEIRTQSPVGRFERASCRERPHTVEDPARWFHPADDFYPPGSGAPTRADLAHLANNDGAVVVNYRPDVPRAARRALRRWAAEGIGVVVAPGSANHSPPLEAFTFDRRLRCDGIDLDRLTTFTDRHFSRPLDHERHGDSSE